MFWAMISKKGGNAPRATDLQREETNPPQASVLHIGTQYLLYRTDSTYSRFAACVCCCWHVSCVTSMVISLIVQ